MRALIIRLRKELRNPDNRNRVIVLAGLLMIALVVLVFNIEWRAVIPDLRNYELRLREYHRLADELGAKKSKLEAGMRNSIAAKEVWVFTSQEDPRLAIMQSLESVSAKCNMNLRSSGSLKDVLIVEGVTGYELDINADPAPLASVCQFIIALSLSQPKFFWDNLTIRPSGENVTLSGKLKVLAVGNNAVRRNYWGGE